VARTAFAGAAANFAAGESRPGERLGETSAERKLIVFGHFSQPLRAGLTSAAPTALETKKADRDF